MQYEVEEAAGEWIVRRRGVEVSRHPEQGDALAEVARHLRETGETGVASLGLRFAARRG